MFRVREGANNRLVYQRVRHARTDLQNEVRHAWFDFMKALRARANAEILRRPKSGRVYIVRDRAGRRRRHVASAPGEAHANLSGATRRSLSWRVEGWERAVFGYGVSTNATNAAPAWAPYLEYGTERMAARPSLKNAIDDVDPLPFFRRALRRLE